MESVNRPILVRVLTYNGPEYLAKELTINCHRHSSMLYYTSRFADLFFSLLITNEARILKCVDSLYNIFGSFNYVPNLFPSYNEVWVDIAYDILSRTAFQDKMIELTNKAAELGEYGIVSHDETFKTLFHLIGQDKMSQKQGELHALHTFRGFSGCTLGMSAQRSTSQDCFLNAVNEVFSMEHAKKVAFLFSDAPKRIYNTAKSVFKSLVAVAEDPMHLVFRLEYCSGRKRLKCPLRVLQLHKKFSVACCKFTSFYNHVESPLNTIIWPTNTVPEHRTPEQWTQFCALPFGEKDGYQCYVAELATISATFVQFMKKRNSNGVTALKILKNASSREHYEYLQNSSRLIALLGKKAVRLAVGTTRNEQLHYEFKSWMRNIRMSHVTRLKICIRTFVFSKLITHSSACYSPTLIQNSQKRLLNLIAGDIRHNGFFHGQISPPDIKYQININNPRLPVNTNVADKRLKKRKIQRRMWSNEKKIPRVASRQHTNIFKQPRSGKRLRKWTVRK